MGIALARLAASSDVEPSIEPSVALAISPAIEPSASLTRMLLVLLVAGAAAGGFLLGGDEASARAVADAGPELTRLLRGMALLKTLLTACALAGVLLRLAAPVPRVRFAVYALACSAMAAGPGLIWRMDHVRTGAFLLHAGLLVAVVALFRDPAVSQLLGARLASRRRQR